MRRSPSCRMLALLVLCAAQAALTPAPVRAQAPEGQDLSIELIDPKAGHIPGAVNYPLTGNLEGGRFRSSKDLAELYRDFPDDGIVSCGSGVNACHAALALVVVGRPMPDVYIGSFSDWSRRDLPIATGPEP